MTPWKIGYVPVLLVVSFLLLTSGGCRTWSSREERGAQAYNEGNRFREAGMNDDALAAYSLALKHEPGMASARFNSALTLAEMGRFDEALEQLHSLNQQDPRNLKVLRALAWVSWKDNRIQDALNYFQSVLILSPGDEASLRGACRIYEATGRAGEAVEMRKLLLRMENSNNARLDLADTLFSAERYQEALEEYRIVLLKNPSDEKALGAAAAAAEKTGQYKEAVVYLRNLADMGDETGELYWRIAGFQLVQDGDFTAGLQSLKTAVAAGFADEEAYRALISEVPAAVRSSVENLLNTEDRESF
jgi:tetratricopeptide (TPR) repeat protein